MKIPATLFLAVAAALLLTGDARSQAPQTPRNALEALQAMKLQNQQLLEKQEATLKKLDEMQLQAQQLKFLGKRS